MEQTPSPTGRSSELPPISPSNSGEIVGPFSNPEVARLGGGERREHSSESRAAEQSLSPSQVVLPAPIVMTPSVSDGDDDTTTTSSLPDVAGDDDLIEKEWVNKAKKVIAETKDDPYRREQEVSRLQADYLSKRYGRTLGSSQ